MSIDNERMRHQKAVMEWLMDNVMPVDWSDIAGAPIHAWGGYAPRVAATWNACQGIPTSDLESGEMVVVSLADLRSLYGWAGELTEIYPEMYAGSLGKVIQERIAPHLPRSTHQEGGE